MVALLGWALPSFGGPLGYKEGRWVFKVKESVFNTGSNYETSGAEKPLPSNGLLQTFTTSVSLTHDFSSSLSIYGIFDFGYGRSRDAQFERTRMVPQDFRIGTDFLLMSGFLDVVPELQLTVPVTTVDEAQDEVILNEGVTEFKIGTYLSKHFNWISGYFYGGYLHRSGGRSSLLPMELQMITDLGGLQLNFGIWGFYSLTDDVYVNEKYRRDRVTSRVNAGSLRFYSINPNLTEAGGSLGFPIGESMFARIGLNTTLQGSRTASGQTYWVSLSHSFGENTPRRRHQDQKKEEKKVQDKMQRQFVPEDYPDEEKTYEDHVVDIVPESDRDLNEPGATAIGGSSKNSGPPVAIKLRKAGTPKAKKAKKKKNRK